VLEDQAAVFDFHLLRRDAHTLELRLPQQGPPGEAAADRCRSALQQFAASQELAPLTLLIKLGQIMPRGRSGKVQRIVALAVAGL